MPDDLTAELDRIAERNEHMRTRYGNVGGLLALAGAKDPGDCEPGEDR